MRDSCVNNRSGVLSAPLPLLAQEDPQNEVRLKKKISNHVGGGKGERQQHERSDRNRLFGYET
eukprot:1182075-Prorocentrum_minimum.AAC.4